MILALLLSVSIASEKTDTFMTIPQWMPSSVASSDTFGSSDHASASHRISSNTLAAVESIFDAYYERAYFMSASGINDRSWNTGIYGANDFRHMSFSAGANVAIMNYRNGERVFPYTRRIVDWDWIDKFTGMSDNERAITKLIDYDNRVLSRDNWNLVDLVYWSSSRMPYARLPPEYEWSHNVPSTNVFASCRPILAYAIDTSLHINGLYRDNTEKYPVPYLFKMADYNYYIKRIKEEIPELKIETTVIDLMNDSFGGNAESGFMDKSRRLKPDDYVNENTVTNSSILATASRALAMMDRTYVLPHLDNTISISNTTKSAIGRLNAYMSGSMNCTGLSIPYRSSSGTFTCLPVRDSDMSIDKTESTNITTTTYQVAPDARRDRGRFNGSSTSISTTDPVSAAGYYVALPITFFLGSRVHSSLIGTNNASIYVYGNGADGAVVSLVKADSSQELIDSLMHEIPAWSLDGTIYSGYEIEKRSSSSITQIINDNISKGIIKDAIPCGSAHDTSRIVNSYASFLCFACEYVHRSGYDAIRYDQEVNYLSVLPYSIYYQSTFNSMTGGMIYSKDRFRTVNYVNARNYSRQKIIDEIGLINQNWLSPGNICSVSTSMVDDRQRGNYIYIRGGTFSLNVNIDGYSEDLVVEVTEYFDNAEINRIGHVSDGGNITWFDSDSSIVISVDIVSFNDEGIGFQINREEYPDDQAVSMDAVACPLVTTDWNWKSLKMSNQ